MTIPYFKEMTKLIQTVMTEEAEPITEAAGLISERLEQGGIIQLFGCGHSHLLALEPYYRAGGLVPVKPIISEPVMLHRGGEYASRNEKDPLFKEQLLPGLSLDARDTVIVISTSGRNPVPIDVARAAVEAGSLTIALSSLFYHSFPARHDGGMRLEEVAHRTINTHVPVGDAVLTGDSDTGFGPSSTVLAGLLLQGLLSEVVRIMADRGLVPPVFKSGNIEGNDEHNRLLMDRYRDRISF